MRLVEGQAVKRVPSRVVAGEVVVSLMLDFIGFGSSRLAWGGDKGREGVTEVFRRRAYRAPIALLSAASSSPGPCDEGLGVVGFCVVDAAAAAPPLRLASVMARGVWV